MNKLFSIFRNKKAFTIAEMTVVLLILSLVMAAILPVTTNKKTSGGGSGSGGGGLWKLARNNTDIWFASPASTQSAMLGTSVTPDAQGLARLYINIPNGNTRSQIGFMYNNTTVGYIRFKENANMGFGTNTAGSPTDAAHNNLGIGYEVLNSGFSGNDNTGIGYRALKNLTSGVSNTAIGNLALTNATTGSNNVAIGLGALRQNTTGTSNFAVGTNSLVANTSGNYNVAIGAESLLNNTIGASNIGIGVSSLKNNTSTNNIGIGNNAGYSNTTGDSNVFIGRIAGYGKIGVANVAIGAETLAASGTSSHNIALGYRALYTNTSGGYNSFIGYQSGYNVTTGNANAGFGQNALDGVQTGSNNTGIGYKACSGVSGSNKTCLGSASGYTNLPSGFTANNTTAETIIGSGSGNIYLHAGNVYVRSGNTINTNSKLTINGNTETTAHLNVGTYANVGTYLHTGSYVNATTTVTAGTSAYSNWTYTNYIRQRTGANYSTEIWGTFTGTYNTISDKRLKNIEGFANTGLNEIKKLDVYKFTYKTEPKVERVGLIAQDVEKVLPYAVTKNDEGYLVLRQDNILFTMFNAIKDLDKLYENLKEKVQDYILRLNRAEDRIHALIEVNKQLSKRVDSLEKRVDALEKGMKTLEKNQCKCK